MFEYFIDLLLSNDVLKPRKCANFDVIPIASIKGVCESSITLRGLLLELRANKGLSLTNLIKFMKKLLTSETKDTLVEKIKKISELS